MIELVQDFESRLQAHRHVPITPTMILNIMIECLQAQQKTVSSKRGLMRLYEQARHTDSKYTHAIQCLEEVCQSLAVRLQEIAEQQQTLSQAHLQAKDTLKIVNEKHEKIALGLAELKSQLKTEGHKYFDWQDIKTEDALINYCQSRIKEIESALELTPKKVIEKNLAEIKACQQRTQTYWQHVYKDADQDSVGDMIARQMEKINELTMKNEILRKLEDNTPLLLEELMFYKNLLREVHKDKRTKHENIDEFKRHQSRREHMREVRSMWLEKVAGMSGEIASLKKEHQQCPVQAAIKVQQSLSQFSKKGDYRNKDITALFEAGMDKINDFVKNQMKHDKKTVRCKSTK